MSGDGFFFQAFVYLTAAVISVPLAKRLGLGSVLGYLIAGVIIGPHVLHLVGEEGENVMHFAEFGVVMMLFLVGLELRPALLWRLRASILGLGGLQVLSTAAAIALIASLFGLDWRMALAVGLTLALSSTAIVIQTLNEKGWMKTEGGKSAFSVLLFQDIAVIPILAILPLLAIPGAEQLAQATQETGAHHDSGGIAVSGWVHTLMVLGTVAGIVLGGRFVVRPVFRFIANTRLPEIFTAAALLLVIGIALAMNLVGLSPALGTFLAGVVLAESEYRHELESTIEPFKGLLLGLFFIAVGASINFNLLAEQPGLIASLVVTLIVIKLIVLFVLGRVFKMELAENLLFAFALAQGGEFAFVLFSFATQNHVISDEIVAPLVVVVALSMAVTPLLFMLFEKLIQPRLATAEEEREADTIDNTDYPVIVAGYGRFGQIVARLLNSNGFATTLLDHDAGQVDLTRRFGQRTYYGDATRIDLLHAAGAENARLLILALGNREKTVNAVTSVRKHFPHLKILARAYDRRHAYELMRVGADVIQRETFGSALRMGEQALGLLGVRAFKAHRATRLFEKHDEETLAELYELWGDEEAYGLRIRQRTADLEKVLQHDQEEQEEEHPDQAWETGPR